MEYRLGTAQKHSIDSRPFAAYCHIADRLCEAGRLGRKTKKGWYTTATAGRRSIPR
ncbi:hypothetical protein F2981_28355 (plasmid) [Sinorhizobium meliloti]|nr:hypothetical protein [Sinorhizobium meliloti]